MAADRPRMTTANGKGEVAVGHNMTGVFVLFGNSHSWWLSPDEARALGATLAAEAGRICDDPACVEATATTDGAGPRHGDGRLARHG